MFLPLKMTKTANKAKTNTNFILIWLKFWNRNFKINDFLCSIKTKLI